MDIASEPHASPAVGGNDSLAIHHPPSTTFFMEHFHTEHCLRDPSGVSNL